MEAMTVMGMAASQARFLGLTARKSNVEYQGQQINQQRTALANESSNLYTQMMELTVPTPPSTSDYMKTSYVLEDSGSYDQSDYQITNLTKTYDKSGEYLINLTTKKETTAVSSETYDFSAIIDTTDPNTGANVKTIRLTDRIDSSKTISLNYIENDLNAYDDKGALSVTANQIYKIDPDKELNGYEQCKNDNPDIAYFYQDKSGKNHFLTEEQLTKMIDGDTDDSYTFSNTYTYSKEVSTQVKGYVETSDTGRYSTIQIEDNENYPNDLRGKTFSLSTVQEMDQSSYDDAYNDYQYQKALYEKSISDINAQTEQIQKKDQQLELRLDQLDTEQNAIATEMDSVTKVIEDNVEKTFKIFA